MRGVFFDSFGRHWGTLGKRKSRTFFCLWDGVDRELESGLGLGIAFIWALETCGWRERRGKERRERGLYIWDGTRGGRDGVCVYGTRLKKREGGEKKGRERTREEGIYTNATILLIFPPIHVHHRSIYLLETVYRVNRVWLMSELNEGLGLSVSKTTDLRGVRSRVE